MLDEIKDVIASNLGLTFGENLFINQYPDDPNTIVTIIDSGGARPNLYNPTREKIVEVKIRANSHKEGTTLGEQIINLFHSKENYDLGGIRVLLSSALSDISYLYADSKERDEFTFELAFLIMN